MFKLKKSTIVYSVEIPGIKHPVYMVVKDKNELLDKLYASGLWDGVEDTAKFKIKQVEEVEI